MNRKNIDVIYRQTNSGRYIPTSLMWGNTPHDIEKVLHTCRSVDGSFNGTRYTVLIDGEQHYIYRDGEDWYVDLIEGVGT